MITERFRQHVPAIDVVGDRLGGGAMFQV